MPWTKVVGVIEEPSLVRREWLGVKLPAHLNWGKGRQLHPSGVSKRFLEDRQRDIVSVGELVLW